MDDSLTSTLRRLLEEMAAMAEVADPQYDDPSARVIDLEFAYRDCRLELLRLHAVTLSDEQVERLRQLSNRLHMVKTGHAVAKSIPSEARRALEVFGWNSTEA
jgi:hypothetical protein